MMLLLLLSFIVGELNDIQYELSNLHYFIIIKLRSYKFDIDTFDKLIVHT
jgi:hypothetical protein